MNELRDQAEPPGVCLVGIFGFIWVWVKIKLPGYGPQVSVHVSIYQGSFWVPIVDPHPYWELRDGFFESQRVDAQTRPFHACVGRPSGQSMGRVDKHDGRNTRQKLPLTDEIRSHHLRNHGIPLSMPTSNGFPWIPSGVKWISQPPTVAIGADGIIRSGSTYLKVKLLTHTGPSQPPSVRSQGHRRERGFRAPNPAAGLPGPPGCPGKRGDAAAATAGHDAAAARAAAFALVSCPLCHGT